MTKDKEKPRPDSQLRSEAFQLAAETGADPRTVRRWLDGKPVRPLTANALEAAAAVLGINGPGQ